MQKSIVLTQRPATCVRPRVTRRHALRCVQILDIPTSAPPAAPTTSGPQIPVPVTAITTAKVPVKVPVPSVVTDICQWYARCLAENPLLTKSTTALVGFCLGDILAQSLEHHNPSNMDYFRMARLSSYGCIIDGPVQHFWYQLLDKTFWPEQSTSTKAVLAKTAADQLIWSPFMTCIFFSWLKMLEGHPDAIVATITAKFVPTLAANYVFWPIVHIFNFRYIPTEYRVLYNQVMCIAWIGFVSMLTHHGFRLGGFCI